MAFAAARRAVIPLPLLVVLPLAGCALPSSALIPIDVAATADLAQVSVLTSGSHHPLLLRGLDQAAITGIRIPNVLQDTSYVLSAGRHTLWLSSVPYGHPLLPQYLRCYTVEAVLEPGSRYLLEEDREQAMARVLAAPSRAAVASGRLVDKALVFQRGCRWP